MLIFLFLILLQIFQVSSFPRIPKVTGTTQGLSQKSSILFFSQRSTRDKINRRLFETQDDSIELPGFSFDDFSDKIIADEEAAMKAEAMALLNCLTSTKDTNSEEYDVEKDIKRDEMLMRTDYEALKIELKTRGLRTSGDKIEMIIRLLLQVIDPTIQYSETSGKEVMLKYIDQDDIKQKKAKKLSLRERAKQIKEDMGPDADDLQVLRKRRTLVAPQNVKSIEDIGKPDVKIRSDEKMKVVMDGMVRKEINYPTCRVRRDEALAKLQDRDVTIRAYVVGGRDVLGLWEKTLAVVVLLPNELGWRSSQIRILADEIAFHHQSIVIVPDIYRGYKEDDVLNQIARKSSRIFDDIVASLYFAKKEYNFKSISLAGVGVGGSLALEASCDLGDIAALAEVKNSESKGEFRSSSAYVNPFIVNRMKRTLELEYTEEFFNSMDNSTSASANNNKEKEQVQIPVPKVDTSEAENKFRQLCANRALERKTLISFPSIPLSTLALLCPLAVVAWTPTDFNVKYVGASLQIPVLIITVGNEKDKAADSFHQIDELRRILNGRSNEILDFSFRSYPIKNRHFITNPADDIDRKCSQESVIIGSYWLDIYSRYAIDDVLDGVGQTKLNEPFIVLSKNDINNLSIMESPIATYLHDEGNMFLNERLPSDEDIMRLSP